MLKVTYFNRDKREGNYSIEELFENIRKHLSSTVIHSNFVLDASISRFRNVLNATKYQGDVNHITGDINYISLGLQSHKTILTVHDLGYYENPIHSFFKISVYKFFWMTLPFKRVRYITTVSEFTKSKILEYVSVEEAKIKVIYNPVDLRCKFTSKKFNAEQPCILAIGSGEHKNFKRLIEAVKEIKCRLCFIGKLDFETISLLEKYKIQYESFFSIDKEKVIQLYVNCDMLFFASLYEGFGLPIVEANAIGRPVITSNCTAMPEVAGDSAILVDPYSIDEIKQAIKVIINDSAYREDLILKGVKNSKRFHIDHIASEYLELYRRILASE